MIDVERLVPGGILCAYSAWSHYGLTTQIPLSYCIAIERSRKVTLPEYPPIELFFLSKSVFELGVSETVIEGFQVKIYDMEKSVCDAVKYRNRIGIDVSRQCHAVGQAYGRTRKIYDLTGIKYSKQLSFTDVGALIRTHLQPYWDQLRSKN